MQISGKRLNAGQAAQLEKWLGERRQLVSVLETEEAVALMLFARAQLESGVGSAISPSSLEHLQRAADMRTTIRVLDEIATRRGDLESGVLIT